MNNGQPEKREKKGWGIRSPDRVIDERIAEVIAILSSRPNVLRSQLHKLLRPRWKNKHGQEADWRTIDRLVSRARVELMARLNRPKESFRCDVLAAYEKELASDKPPVRLAALAGIRELLGLDAPRQVRQEIGGIGGGPVQTEDVTDIPKLSKSRLLEIITSGGLLTGGRENGNGSGHHGNGHSNGNGEASPHVGN